MTSDKMKIKSRYRLWQFFNLIDWTFISSIRSYIDKEFSWCPFGFRTGFEVWRIIHDIKFKSK